MKSPSRMASLLALGVSAMAGMAFRGATTGRISSRNRAYKAEVFGSNRRLSAQTQIDLRDAAENKRSVRRQRPNGSSS